MTLQEKYNAINEGAFSKQQFLRDARLAFPQIITQFNSYEDASQILKNKGIIGEAEKKVEPVKFDPADKIAPDVLDQGIKAELEKKGLPANQTPTSEEYAAAKKKAVANITKDLLYYKNAQTMASSKSEKMEKAKVKLTEIKEGNLGHNELASLEPEGRFWIVTYRTMDGIKEKTFTDQDKARAFMKSVNESVNGDFAKFDILKMAVVQHEKGAPYYDKTRLINIFNRLDSPDQERAKREYSQYFGESVNEGRPTPKVGDLVGNNVQGFNFKLLGIKGSHMEVQDEKTGIKFKTHIDNMYVPSTSEAKKKPMKPELKESHVRKLAELILEAKLAEAMDVNDPVLMKARAAAFQRTQPKPELPKPVKTINPDYKAIKNADKIKALKKQRAQLMRDMEQEAEPEGGPIADRYGRELEKIDKAISMLMEDTKDKESLRYALATNLAKTGKPLKESHVRKLAELILEAKLAEEMSVHGELQRILDTDTPKVAQGAAIALEALKKFYAASENLTRKLEKAYKITGPFMAPALGAAVVKQINDIVTKPYKAEMPKAKMVNIAKINDFETLAKETGISVEDLKNMQRQFKTGMTALPTVNETKKRNTKSLATLLETQTNTTDISNAMNVREVGGETYFLDNREVEVLDFGTHDSGNGEHRVALSAKFVDTGEFLDEEELILLNQETFESDYVNPFEFGDEDAFDIYEAKAGEKEYFLKGREVEVLDFDIHDSGNGYHRIPVIAKFVDTGNFLTQDELETLSQESFESDYVNPFEFGDEDALDMYEAQLKEAVKALIKKVLTEDQSTEVQSLEGITKIDFDFRGDRLLGAYVYTPEGRTYAKLDQAKELLATLGLAIDPESPYMQLGRDIDAKAGGKKDPKTRESIINGIIVTTSDKTFE